MTENELSSIIIGEAIFVHKKLGPGLLESVYEECLIYRLIQRNLKVERQKPIPLVFESIRLQCGYRCDIIVENLLIIEVKSVDAINEIHFAQVITYLKLANIRLGLLINFNVVQLKTGIKRIVNKL